MAEGVIQPEADHEENLLKIQQDTEIQQSSNQPIVTNTDVAQISVISSGERIIWTPSFILIFILTLVLGTSAESLLTSGWANHLFPVNWLIIQVHVIAVALAWLVLGIVTRSRWVRIGCIFGGVWAIFMTFNIIINVYGLNNGIAIQSYINVATCMALLGAYIGISIEKTILSVWDTWIFILMPILGAIGVFTAYFLTPQASIATVENATALAAMTACTAFWWLRPSCWKVAPGPTFLLGSVPLLLILLALFNNSSQNIFLLQVTYPFADPISNANNLLFAQFAQLCLLLGCLRLIKESSVSHAYN
jgi:hypothetical protein